MIQHECLTEKNLKPVDTKFLASLVGRAAFNRGKIYYLDDRVGNLRREGNTIVATESYYGFHSNKLRGLRKKTGCDDRIPALIESEISSKEFRKNWARLIHKVYNVNPLVCSKCSGSMRIISFIEDEQLLKKILNHLGLWDVKRKPAPCANGPPPEAFIIYDQSSSPSADDYIIDADYPIDLARRSSKNEDGNLHLKKIPPQAHW